MSQLATLTNKLATKLDMGDGSDLIDTLKATAFRGQVSDSQMVALLTVANQHGLNPWTKEIYAFPDKQNGIVPVVGVDGWSRIINSHEKFDGMNFDQDDESCTCSIFRKDRSHPTTVTEFLSECKRETQPWKSHPKRMLRHKAMIQAARLAFGYGGIFDQDEAERIVEATTIDAETGEITGRKPEVSMPKRREAATDVQPKPTQKAARPADDGMLATVGEVAFITKKIAAAGLSIEQAREQAGLEPLATLEGLTKDGFVALKDSLTC